MELRQRPNAPGRGRCANPTVEIWFDNPAFYCRPFHLLRSVANILREGRNRNLDFSVFKRSAQTEFRVECVNLTKRHFNAGPPRSTPRRGRVTISSARPTASFGLSSTSNKASSTEAIVGTPPDLLACCRPRPAHPRAERPVGRAGPSGVDQVDAPHPWRPEANRRSSERTSRTTLMKDGGKLLAALGGFGRRRVFSHPQPPQHSRRRAALKGAAQRYTGQPGEAGYDWTIVTHLRRLRSVA